MSFIYSLIAKSADTILCEHTDYTGNFMQITRIILQKGVNLNSKYIINTGKYKIHYINEDSITYMSLTEEVEDKLAFAFLTEVKNELLQSFNVEDLQNFLGYQLKEGTDILKKYMNYYNSHPEKTKAGEVIKELTVAKDALIQNLEKIIERDNKMEIIAHKSDNLKDMSVNINSVADIMRKNESTRKNKYIFFAIILVGILIILFVCLK